MTCCIPTLRLIVALIGTVLCGCQCVESYAAETEGVLSVGENEFEIVFGEGTGSPLIFVTLGECAEGTVVEIGDREYAVDPVDCRSDTLGAFAFAESTVLMNVRSNAEVETVVTVVSPGTDCDDQSELVVESIRQL